MLWVIVLLIDALDDEEVDVRDPIEFRGLTLRRQDSIYVNFFV